jgi:hypothetical protein
MGLVLVNEKLQPWKKRMIVVLTVIAMGASGMPQRSSLVKLNAGVAG